MWHKYVIMNFSILNELSLEGRDNLKKKFLKFFCQEFRYNFVRDIATTNRLTEVDIVQIISF